MRGGEARRRDAHWAGAFNERWAEKQEARPILLGMHPWAAPRLSSARCCYLGYVEPGLVLREPPLAVRRVLQVVTQVSAKHQIHNDIAVRRI